MKKILASILAVILAVSGLSIIPVTASVANLVSGDYEYSVNSDDTVCIEKYIGTDSNVTIPSTIDGKTVTKLGYESFANCTTLKTVTIPNSLTSIGYYAFEKCTALKSITIPNTVTKIDSGAFYYCTSLSNVTLPKSLTELGYSAFAYCTSLKSITIPKSLTVTSARFDENESPFAKSGLITAIIEDGATEVSEALFRNATNLKNVTIPNTVTKIESYAFDRCYSLENITLPNSLTFIENVAFAHSSLKTVTIPNSVTYIGGYAFSCCTLLKSITIPNAVTEIGNYAFNSCGEDFTIYGYRFSQAYFYANNNGYKFVPLYYTEGDFEYSIVDMYNCIYIEKYLGNDADVVIPSTIAGKEVLSIEDGAFTDCSTLKTVTIPSTIIWANGEPFADSGLTTAIIEDGAYKIAYGLFKNATNLTTVIIPDSVTYIDNYAFENCNSLKSVILPDSIKDICLGAFSNCTSLKSITIPKSVEYINDTAFEGCNEDFIIYGYANSYAQTYAEENGITFVALGDIDGDGEINVSDVTNLQIYLAECEDEEMYVASFDVNGDGQLNVLDATEIQFMIAS